MKRIILVSMTLVAVIAFFSFRSVGNNLNKELTMNAGGNVEVYYFHFSRRCVTCLAVENEARKSVETLYPDQVKKGIVSFASVNLEDESSKDVAERCKVTGQTLLVISGDSRIDLTDKGFMYAKTSPDKLRSEIRDAIDPLLKALE